MAAPPSMTDIGGGSLFQALFSAAGSLGMVAFAFIYKNKAFLIIAGALALLSLVFGMGMHLQQKRGSRRQRRKARQRYLDHLADRERVLDSVADAQRAAALRLYPDPDFLWFLAANKRFLWERRPGHEDFLHVRIGRGKVALQAPLRFDVGNDPSIEHDPELLQRARDLVSRYEFLSSEPVVIPARDLGTIAVSGDRERTTAWVRAMILQAAAFHAPRDLRMMAYSTRGAKREWEWMKWLPHSRGSLVTAASKAASTPACNVTADLSELELWLDQLVEPRIAQLERAAELSSASTPPVPFQQVILVIDGFDPRARVARLTQLDLLFEMASKVGVTVLAIMERPDYRPPGTSATVDVADTGLLRFEETRPNGRREREVRADSASVDLCEAVARALAPLRLSDRQGHTTSVESVRLLELLGLSGTEAIDPAVTWRPRRHEDLLRVPAGVREDGEVLLLDFKQQAEGGMGPHGLLVGALGSGKSELLRTLVTGLAITHPPEVLNFIFVDFKGAAAFAGLSQLPHCAGMITNLEHDLTMVDRMRDSLLGEKERRERLLHQAGRLDDVRQYQERRAVDPRLEPLPYLLLFVDEFGELLDNRDDFREVFITIGRVGRSLGMHLLVANQGLEGKHIHGLERHLRYRACLQTFNAEESMAVLGTKDASELPPLPGVGYFKVGGEYHRFKGALVTAPDVKRSPAENKPTSVHLFDAMSSVSVAPVAPISSDGDEEQPRRTWRREMDVAIERLAGAAPPARQIWLPPLEAKVTLDRVLPLDGGGAGAEMAPADSLEVPIGLLDRPRDQRQEPLVLDFAGAGGHLAVVGAPQSGKSTLLETLVTAFALSYSPRDVQFYCIDLGGGGLHSLAAVPHVGDVCGRQEADKVRRLLRQMQAVIAEREMMFRQRGIRSMSDYRQVKRARQLGDPYGDVFLLLDNWAAFRQEFDELEPEVTEIAAVGLNYGVHVIIASSRWSDIRSHLRDNLGSRVELELNDPLESEIGRQPATALASSPAGRGLTGTGLRYQTGLQFQVALPYAESLTPEEVTASVAERWNRFSPAPPVRMLPQVVQEEDLSPVPALGLPIGVEEIHLESVGVDLFDAQPHLLVLGDGESGKTNLLRLLIQGVDSRFAPDRCHVALVDYRRTIRDVSRRPVVQSYASTPAATTELVARLQSTLRGRLPSAELSADELDQRRWWSGPDIVLVVDDYDLVTGQLGSPLADLADLVAHGRDIGFHVVLARRVRGTARSSFEPLFQRLQELNTPGLILSGDPDEGPLLGSQKAVPLQVGRAFFVRHQRPPVLVQTAHVKTSSADRGQEGTSATAASANGRVRKRA